MNSQLRIQIRIISQQALAALKQLRSEITALSRLAAPVASLGVSSSKINTINKALGQWNSQNRVLTQSTVEADRASVGFLGRLNNLAQGSLRLGKSIQSAGRQLTYNFTYPLLQAGKAIFAYAQAQQVALTNLQKVYGDADTGAQKFAQDQGALGRIFRDLSDIYGVQISDVTGLAAAWAAAGLTGYDLAKATETTMKALNLFDFASPQDAVKSLISIQTAYKLNADELSNALFTLNAVENSTAVSGVDLVNAFVRVGSTAQSSGVTIKELAADIAALVPSTGSAETAGNGLKTIFTRLMAPTTAARQAFQNIGIEFENWNKTGATAQDRLMDLAKTFKGLDSTTRINIATQIAGRFQVNRFFELMKALVDPTSAYSTALRVGTDDSKAFALAQNEINLKLASSPQRFKILQTRIQNLLAAALMPMIPILIKVIAHVEQFVQAFSNLPEGIKKMIIFGLVILAVIGPIVRLTGAFIELFSIIGTVSTFMAGPGLTVIVAAAPWILLAAAIIGVVAVLIIFRNQIMGGVKNAALAVWGAIKKIGDAFAALPGIVQQALLGVLRVVVTVIKQIFNWLSYLNPWAHHSPSLVEQVDSGIARIASAYAKLSNIGNVFRQAAADFKQFQEATKGTRDNLSDFARAQQREQIVGNAPETGTFPRVPGGAVTAGPRLPNAADTVAAADFKAFQERVIAYDAMVKSIDDLTAIEGTLSEEYSKQAAIVDRLGLSLDNAQRAYDDQNRVLTAMKDKLSAIGDALSAEKQKLDDFVNAPLAGMKAMNEQIFQNDIEQKKLRLEMLRMEDAGQTVDVLTKKLADLESQIQSVRSREEELRSGGAGSDILKFYDDQISALEAQRRIYNEQLAPIKALQDALDELKHKGEELDLEKSINFDPLTHQIQLAADTTKELTFDEIIAGIKEAQPRVENLTAAFKVQQDLVTGQQAVVDQYKAALDTLQGPYDAEKARLDDLGYAYDKVKANIDLLESSIQDLIKAQDALAKSGTGAGSDFADPAGLKSSEGDLQKILDKLDKDTKDSVQKLDPFAGIRKWFKDRGIELAKMGALLGRTFAKVFFGDWLKKAAKEVLFGSWLKDLGKTVFSGIWSGMVWVWDHLLWPWIKHIPGAIKEALLGDWLKDAGKAILQGLWDGMTWVWDQLWDFFFGHSIKTDIIGYFLDAPSWLLDIGGKIFQGLWNGFQTKWDEFWNWLGNIGTWVADRLGDAASWLWQKGWDIITGLANGVHDKWDELWTWLGSVGTWIQDAWGNAGDWLYNIGLDIMGGLLQGFQDGVQAITDWWPDWLPGLGDIPIPSIHIPGMPGTDSGVTVGPPPAMIGGPGNSLPGLNSKSSSSITFNGDLSFPNITSPDDAEKFISNLEALAGSR